MAFFDFVNCKLVIIMNGNSRYQFENHPKQKGVCPKCHQQKKFRYLLDTNNGLRIDEKYGKCDRVNNCGHEFFPWQDVGFIHPDTNTAKQISSIQIEQKFVGYTNFTATQSGFESNTLLEWLVERFDPVVVNMLVKEYKVGSIGDGDTVFWQINQEGKVCNGIRYTYLSNGHRDKSRPPSYLYTAQHGYNTCLFGEHLLGKYAKDNIVAIVESEKTAIIGSAFYPEFIWLASNGSNGLSNRKIQVLRERKVMLVPDLDKAGRSSFQKSKDNLEAIGCKVDFLDLFPDEESGRDLCDILHESQFNKQKYIFFNL